MFGITMNPYNPGECFHLETPTAVLLPDPSRVKAACGELQRTELEKINERAIYNVYNRLETKTFWWLSLTLIKAWLIRKLVRNHMILLMELIGEDEKFHPEPPCIPPGS